MAQTRRYTNALPSYVTNHNVNGTSERVEEREKAKIARERNIDPEGNKNPSFPLFPSPRRVEKDDDDDDGISTIIKNVLGDYKKFKRICKQETCIGVVPIPATPTDTKSQYFPEDETKPKKSKEKLKPNADPSKEKVHKPSQKPGLKDSGEATLENKHRQNKPNKTSVDQSKNSGTIECGNIKTEPNTMPPHKSKFGTSVSSKTSGDIASNSKNQETKFNIKNAVNKPEDCNEASHQESSDIEKLDLLVLAPPPPKSRPTHIKIPSQDNTSNSLIKSPLSDMKVHSILKEMTEPVTVPPLTGIFTPVSKLDCRFPFPSNINEKDILEVPDRKNSLGSDLVISEDDDSEDEQENPVIPNGHDRIGDHSRSRSSSSSSDSSSEDSNSSDSEGEQEPSDRQNWNNVPKQSNLNASPNVALPAAALTATLTPKNVNSEQLGESEHATCKRTSPNVISNPDKILENRQTDLDNCRTTNSSNVCNEPLVDGSNESTHPKSYERGETTLRPGDQLQAVSDPCLSSKNVHRDETKIKTEPEQSRGESLGTKTELKKLSPTKSETKDHQLLKGAAGELCWNDSHKLENNKLKHGRGLNEVLKSDKHKERNEKEKVEVKKKVSKLKSETTGVVKENKRKIKDRTSESKRPQSKKVEIPSSKKVEIPSSKNLNFTKTLSKEVKEPDKEDRVGFDTHSDDAEEDTVIDVVGCESPVIKKKKTEGSKVANISDVNGRIKNGHHDLPLDIQVVRDQDKEPKSLVVRIDLSLLKRIPTKSLENDKIAVSSTYADVELSAVANIEKRSTHSEPVGKMKKKELNGDNEQKNAEQTSSEKKRHQNGHTKRSPSWDNDHCPKKRVRRNTDREKTTTAHKSRPQKTMAEQNAEVVEDIKKVNPDSHLHQAKTLKREADKLTDKEAKSRTYVEAIIRFICCGRVLEEKDETETRAGQMYSETTELLRFVLKHVLGKSDDKRLLVLCLRVQSLLLHKLYRMKSKLALRNSQILAEHFKATHKNSITSPYTTSNKHVSTPSPMSPTPSPAGSVGSISSSSSGEGNNTSSQNGRPLPAGSNSSVTSPVSISIPQRIHTVMSQHVSTTSKLVHSIDIWDKADSMMADYQEFFNTMDSICGALTFHSSIAHIVNYVKKSLSKLADLGKET